MTNDSAIILNYLLDQSDLTTLTGTRIWAEADTPPATYRPSEGPAICFKRRGGVMDEEAVILSPSYQFKIYGADGATGQSTSPEASADTVYRKLFDVLNFAGTALIRGVQLEAMGQTLREPDTKWTYMLVYFRAQVVN